MTLRLRLTLFYTLLVVLVLGLSGAALHVLLLRNLMETVNDGLAETVQLLRAADDSPIKTPSGVDELVAVRYDADGGRVQQVGAVPPGLPPLRNGYVTWEHWRVLTRPLGAGTVAALQDLDDVNVSLGRFDRLFLLLVPVAVSLAFGLGYALAGRVLAPVNRLTHAAHDLARRRAWQERLPEPKQRDELWRLAQGTNELLGALEGVIENERRFTADAAHELRTPLTVLQGRLEEALEEADDPVQVRRSLRKAQHANAKLLGIVTKLLVLARAEAGQGLGQTRVALNEIASGLVEELCPSFSEKGLTLSLTAPNTPVWVGGDRVALTLLVRNLLDNALKFSPAGTVSVLVAADSGRVKLTVSDRGPGIPAAALPNIFRRFYQVDVRHRQGGSGLGLALVQSIAAWHGGRVWAENRAGGGACFRLELPLYNQTFYPSA